MISIIVATDKNRLIGSNGKLPWSLPEDLAYFKRTTLNKKVIMGRKTFESLPNGPLKNRHNIILTKGSISINNHILKNNESIEYDNYKVSVVSSIDFIIEKYFDSNEEVFVIGGSQVYFQVLPYTKKIYLTYINDEFKGDSYFPEIDKTKWKKIFEQKGIKNEKNPYDYYFQIWTLI